MRVEFVMSGFVDLDPGFRLRVGRRDYVVLQFSAERFDDAGKLYHRYDVEIGAPEHYQHCDEEILAIDLDSDRRVMSWRTSGVGLFDVESMRGTAHVHDLSEFESQVRGWVQDYVSPLLQPDRAARIRAEVEAMDWPEVIGE